jgi:putative phosphoribosyl transferase
MIFKTREQAGKKLVPLLKGLKLSDPVVIALSNGGVPVAAQVASALHADLDVLAVKKFGTPEAPEYVIGALTEEGYYYIHDSAFTRLGLSLSEIEVILLQKQALVLEKISLFRHEKPLTSVTGRDVILMDDGLASGASARVSLKYLKSKNPKNIILAVPVCSRKITDALTQDGQQVVCLQTTEGLHPVSDFYEDYFHVTDQKVIQLLHAHQKLKASTPLKSSEGRSSSSIPSIPSIPSISSSLTSDGSSPPSGATHSQSISRQEVLIEDFRSKDLSLKKLVLPGILQIPSPCSGIVLFAHGSGSSRLSPRNQLVAQLLNQGGLGTLLFDLLTPEEAQQRENVFQIPLLGSRLVFAMNWLKSQVHTPSFASLPLGLFGASTGAAAALWAAAQPHSQIAAVVSRGGRPDLADAFLSGVHAPVLLIVGFEDQAVIERNQEALTHLKNARLHLIAHATHLFEEPGALEEVAQLAAEWFNSHFKTHTSSSRRKKIA